MNHAHLKFGLILSTAMLAVQPLTANDQPSSHNPTRLERQIRRELITLPFYSLFDHFSFKVVGETVILMGKVSRPTLKSDAENAVKKIEGVEKITNQIEILPLSPNDDRLRLALHQAIYGHSVLQVLSIRAILPIHILVENGKVTLEGIVATDMQKSVAAIQANSVASVFAVTNNLTVESKN